MNKFKVHSQIGQATTFHNGVFGTVHYDLLFLFHLARLGDNYDMISRSSQRDYSSREVNVVMSGSSTKFQPCKKRNFVALYGLRCSSFRMRQVSNPNK